MSSQSASTHFGGEKPHHHVTGAALNQFWSWIIGAKQAALIVIKDGHDWVQQKSFNLFDVGKKHGFARFWVYKYEQVREVPVIS